MIRCARTHTHTHNIQTFHITYGNNNFHTCILNKYFVLRLNNIFYSCIEPLGMLALHVHITTKSIPFNFFNRLFLSSRIRGVAIIKQSGAVLQGPRTRETPAPLDNLETISSKYLRYLNILMYSIMNVPNHPC